MQFHQRTLALVGQENLRLDLERSELAAQAAHDMGFTLPEAVKEWYAVPKRSRLWSWYSCDHYPAVPKSFRISAWAESNILEVFYENQGCATWGVALDGSNDPPALISYGEAVEWRVCAASFSDFVYTRIFHCPFGRNGRGYYTTGRHVTEQELEWFRQKFREEPTTLELGGLTTYRFSFEKQRFEISNDMGRSVWSLVACSAAGLDELQSRLSRFLERD